jgi:hypothetical protein
MVNVVEVTVDSTDTDDQTAAQVVLVPIAASATKVAISSTDVQAAIDEVSVYLKDRPTLAVVNTALTNYADAFNLSQTAQDAQIGNLQSGQTAAAGVLSAHDASIIALQDKKRSFSKVGTTQATNNDDVLVGDDVFHTGKTIIGASTDDGTGQKLQVDGGASVKVAAGFNVILEKASGPYLAFSKNGTVAATISSITNSLKTDVPLGVNMTSSSPAEALEVVGNAQATGNMYAAAFIVTSSEKSKDIVKEITESEAIDVINGLGRVVDFKYKKEFGDPEKLRTGFIAEDVAKVANNAVHLRKYPKFDEKGEQLKYLEDSVFVPNEEQKDDKKVLKEAEKDFEKSKAEQIDAYHKSKEQQDQKYELYNGLAELEKGFTEPYLVLAVRYLLAQNEELKARIEKLESGVKKLKV